MTNVQILHGWTGTNGSESTADTGERVNDHDGLTPVPLTANGLPPPAD